MDTSYFYFQNSNVHIVQNNLDNTRTATYAYDNLSRISSAASQATSGANCWGQSYSYDRYGNLTAINSTQCSSPTMSVTVNPKNQVTNSGFTYDSGGNLTSDGVYTYAWVAKSLTSCPPRADGDSPRRDGENRLTSVNGVTYSYDGDGKRVMKSNGTIYWYDLSGNVLEETDSNGNRQSAYIYFGGKRVGRYDASGAHYAYLSDLIGSSVMVTDAMGHIQNSSDYYPFGGERHVTSTLTDHYKFTSMERDSESGLDHTLFRQFTSTYGRWLSPDPDCFGCTSPQKLNRYSYVLNNPVTLTDPLGLDPGDPGDINDALSSDSCGDYFYALTHTECPPIPEPFLPIPPPRHRKKVPCDAKLPSGDAGLLSQLIFAEAARPWITGISSGNSAKEMAAIAWTAIDRANYLQSNPKTSLSFFSATARTIQGVVNRNQFGSVGSYQFNLAATPQRIDVSIGTGQDQCDFLKAAIGVAVGSLSGKTPDPFGSLGGVYAFRPDDKSPGPNYFRFDDKDQIMGTPNTFWGLTPQ